MTLGSGLFSAWRFYEDWTFTRNLKRTLHYILNEGESFRKGILTNRHSLLALADITHSNFHKMHHKFIGLANKISIHFHHFTNSLIPSNRDTVFYQNYLQYYMNTMDKVNTELENYNNEMQMAKSILYTKTRTFVSGLHILAENKIPESILHANVFKNILVTVQDQLELSKEYTLLYGSTVNSYYHMGIANGFILNNILYINLLLPLEHLKHQL